MVNSSLVLELWRMKETNCAKTTKVHIKVNHLPSINSKLLLLFFLTPVVNLETSKVGNLFFMS